MADYSNAGFVTAATNFVGSAGSIRPPPSYPKPDGAGAQVASVQISDLRNEVGCRGTEIPPGLTGAVLFVGTPVTDNYAGITTWNPRTSTFSIFDEDLKRYADLDGIFTLNRFNFCEAHKLLIPRAVAYSAGLINYFFRGEMEISLPYEGVYGIIDHNIATNSNSLMGGFPKIKVKLRNVTSAGIDASGNPVVEPMTEGSTPTLIAVAKFHRNTCYTADLSGEYGSPGKDWSTCRSPVEEIVLSDPVPVPTGINSAPQPVTFTFPNRIPISATDLYLQVIYRGRLGDEADAVVVATRDISEPRYIHTYARWDQYAYAHWPSVDLGPYSWAEWCAQGGYQSLEDCNRDEGQTGKAQYSPTSSPIPGYDSANSIVPPNTWTSVSQETAVHAGHDGAGTGWYAGAGGRIDGRQSDEHGALGVGVGCRDDGEPIFLLEHGGRGGDQESARSDHRHSRSVGHLLAGPRGLLADRGKRSPDRRKRHEYSGSRIGAIADQLLKQASSGKTPWAIGGRARSARLPFPPMLNS